MLHSFYCNCCYPVHSKRVEYSADIYKLLHTAANSNQPLFTRNAEYRSSTLANAIDYRNQRPKEDYGSPTSLARSLLVPLLGLHRELLQRLGHRLRIGSTLCGISTRKQLGHLRLPSGESGLELLCLLWAPESDREGLTGELKTTRGRTLPSLRARRQRSRRLPRPMTYPKPLHWAPS